MGRSTSEWREAQRKGERMSVFSIPGKLDVNWRFDVKAIVDTWTSYAVTLDELKMPSSTKASPMRKPMEA